MSKVPVNKNVVKNKSTKSRKPTKKKAFRSDVAQMEELLKAGKLGTTKAVRDSKSLGLTITYIEKDHLVEELPDGRKRVLKQTSKSRNLKLKKGVILHAR